MAETARRTEFIGTEVDSGTEAVWSLAFQAGLKGIFEYATEKAGHLRMGTLKFGTLPGAIYGDSGACQTNDHAQIAYGTGVSAVSAVVNMTTGAIEIRTTAGANGVTVTGKLCIWSD